MKPGNQMVGSFEYTFAGLQQTEPIFIDVPDAEDVSEAMSKARDLYDEVYTDTLFELQEFGAENITYKEVMPDPLF